MKRQRGQSALEFALMAPIVFLMIFAAIYGGIMFMDYLNFSNEARAIARQIAVSPNKTAAIQKYSVSAGGSTLERFYTVKITANTVDSSGNEVSETSNSAEDVVVTVTFNRDNRDLPWIVYKVGFPPESFALQYRMKLEK